MRENFLSQSEIDPDLKQKFPVIKSGCWIFSVDEADKEKLITKQALDLGEREEVFHGIYFKHSIPELNADIFILDDEKSDSGVLPHGSACYLKNWDVILARAGVHGFIDLSRESLSEHEFTVLAHELGHREDYNTTDDEKMQTLSYGEKEIRAWQHAKRLFGDSKKFDHEYADRDIESYGN